MMKRIFIVRHGKTQWNLDRRLQGAHSDSHLLLTDLTAYQRLATYLGQYTFAAWYSSPLPRALETAQIVQQQLDQQIPIRLVPDLAELSFGQWEGRLRAELMGQSPQLFAKLSRRENDPGLAALQVEDFDQARHRFASAIYRVSQQLGANENALVFSHGGISQLGIKTLIGNEHLLGLNNLATSIIGFVAHQAYLEVYNQTAYLPQVDLDEGNTSILPI